MLSGVQVEHEVGQRAFQLCAGVPIDGKARAGKFYRARQIENAKLLSQLPMRLWREAELRRRAPAADFDIIITCVAHRHGPVRHIATSRMHPTQPLLLPTT